MKYSSKVYLGKECPGNCCSLNAHNYDPSLHDIEGMRIILEIHVYMHHLPKSAYGHTI